MSEHQPFYLAQNTGLGTALSEDDLLHPAQNALVDDSSATETQYFGFCVSEEKLHGIGYLWHHPKLKTVSGGVYAWRGVKPHFVFSDLIDVRTHMSDAALAGDLYDYRLDNGYGVKIIEPLKHHHMTYADPARGQRVDLHFKALQPPVMFGDGNHFEQPMRVQGELDVRGHTFQVDCYTIRDRSWGKPRQEVHQPFAPYSWISCVFSPDFSFNCGVFDQAKNNPELTGQFALPHEKTLAGGWLQRGGKLARIVSAEKRVVRTPDLCLPTEVELDITDELGRTAHIHGTMLAANSWPLGGQIGFVICFMRWECDGQVTYGDCQEGIWSDYLNAYSSCAK